MPKTEQEINAWVEATADATSSKTVALFCVLPDCFEEFKELFPDFGWDDADLYWQGLEGLAHELDERGHIIGLTALEDVGDYLEWCDFQGVDPRRPESRSYWAEEGLVVRYQGSIEYSLLAYKLEEMLEHLTPDDMTASDFMEFIGGKAAAFILQEIKPNIQEHAHLNVTLTSPVIDIPLEFVYNDDQPTDIITADTQELAAMYAVAIGLISKAGVSLRSMEFDEEGDPVDTELRSWLLEDTRVQRFSAGQVMDMHCLTEDGDIMPPEYGVEYMGPEQAELIEEI